MKNKISALLALLLGFVLTSCDKFDLDFTTKSNFNLDASSHELEVKTKQDDAIITHIVLNGKEFWIEYQEIGFEGTKMFETFEVHYVHGFPHEIEGEWFKVRISDAYTFHISISENNDLKSRMLDLNLIWRSASNTITIRQEKK